MREIVCRIDRCLGCKSCEIACAVVHSEVGSLIEAIQQDVLPHPRVQVLSMGESGELVRRKSLALQCRHCEEPACVEVCIAGGVIKDLETGRVTFDAERCVGCYSCIMVCPFGGVIRLKRQGIAVKCDGCPDLEEPACVKACPTRALIVIEEEMVVESQ
jgi:anaerobic carbon-monoxide dehydrogenase iron sulfur subunit